MDLDQLDFPILGFQMRWLNSRETEFDLFKNSFYGIQVGSPKLFHINWKYWDNTLWLISEKLVIDSAKNVIIESHRFERVLYLGYFHIVLAVYLG